MCRGVRAWVQVGVRGRGAAAARTTFQVRSTELEVKRTNEVTHKLGTDHCTVQDIMDFITEGKVPMEASIWIQQRGTGDPAIIRAIWEG